MKALYFIIILLKQPLKKFKLNTDICIGQLLKFSEKSNRSTSLFVIVKDSLISLLKGLLIVVQDLRFNEIYLI